MALPGGCGQGAGCYTPHLFPGHPLGDSFVPPWLGVVAAGPFSGHPLGTWTSQVGDKVTRMRTGWCWSHCPCGWLCHAPLCCHCPAVTPAVSLQGQQWWPLEQLEPQANWCGWGVHGGGLGCGGSEMSPPVPSACAQSWGQVTLLKSYWVSHPVSPPSWSTAPQGLRDHSPTLWGLQQLPPSLSQSWGVPGRRAGVPAAPSPRPAAAGWAWPAPTLRSSRRPTCANPTSSTSSWPCTTGRASPWRSSAPPSSTSWRRSG